MGVMRDMSQMSRQRKRQRYATLPTKHCLNDLVLKIMSDFARKVRHVCCCCCALYPEETYIWSQTVFPGTLYWQISLSFAVDLVYISAPTFQTILNHRELIVARQCLVGNGTLSEYTNASHTLILTNRFRTVLKMVCRLSGPSSLRFSVSDFSLPKMTAT